MWQDCTVCQKPIHDPEDTRKIIAFVGADDWAMCPKCKQSTKDLMNDPAYHRRCDKYSNRKRKKTS